MMASYFAIHEVTTVSLLSPSISGSVRMRFSIWCLNTSLQSCWLSAPPPTICAIRSLFRKTSL